MNDFTGKIKVFDAYGTLLVSELGHRPNPYKVVKDWLVEHGADPKGLARLLMTQKVPVEHVPAMYGVPSLSKERRNEFERIYNEDINALFVRPELIKLFQAQMESGYPVVVASNLAVEYSYPLIKALHQIEKVGSLSSHAPIRLALSYELGLLKPDLAFYKEIESQLSIQFPELLSCDYWMSGDKEEEDVQGPRRAGWDAQRIQTLRIEE